MKNSILGLVVLLVVGGVVGAALLFSQKNEGGMAIQQTEIVDESMEKKDASAPASPVMESEKMMNQQYMEYSPEQIIATTDKRRVLYFYANWCPTCAPADKDFRENFSQLPEDLVVLRVNYNDSDTDGAEKELAKKYGVTYQHTFVQIDAEGEKITVWNGGMIPELLDMVQ
ncbi:MAG: redoxin domain-containing protein [Candidatus Pacebacteria bacterium]|nr:redoxin domain-containing protein [Candidatus Paceibacterota bacterium]PIR60390.1 MAG: hypothetical protein COU67_02440 [Candidatus Pacebacteria bacterium CG10_big_fil_rev_8_21_14_0_10_44_54]